MTKQGFEICIEGIDGAGKSTIVPRIASKLVSLARLPCLVTEQPTRQGHWGRQIRNVLTKVVPDPGPDAMAVMFAADRREQCVDVVRPAIERGEIVLSDRGILSSVAYQGGVGQVSLSAIYRYNGGIPRPRLCIVLDVSPEVARARREARGLSPELFDDYNKQLRVQAVYDCAEGYDIGSKVVHVDANGELAEVELAVWAVVEAEIEAWKKEKA